MSVELVELVHEQNFDRWICTNVYARVQNCPYVGLPKTGTRLRGESLEGVVVVVERVVLLDLLNLTSV